MKKISAQNGWLLKGLAIFALLCSSSLSHAQNLDALLDVSRFRVSDSTAFLELNMLVLGVVGLLYILFARPLIGLFTEDTEVLAMGAQSLWIVSLAFPMYAAGMCFESAFNGAGDTWTPARLNLYCLWLGQIPLAWLLAKTLELGPVGVFIAVPSAFTLLTISSAVLFKRGRWKQMKV